LEQDRLEVTGSDELARLGRTFNATLDALERSIQSQRNLVADASHELRTPIASVRANLQLLRDEALLSPEDRAALRRDMIEELDELTALVADVVELARGSKPSPSSGEVRLDAIVTEALQRVRRRAPGVNVRVALEPTLVRGEGERIARAVNNLLDNAAKWGAEGGVIEVDLAGGVLGVRDHGPGFHEEDLPYVFDRFHRARDARGKPGSGLGLAIVRQAAEAHGGFVEAANAPGGGALMRIGFGPPLPLGDEAEATETISAS
jgi:two-component system sensor histidine kinase MprB